jgi:hypothetical protein
MSVFSTFHLENITYNFRLKTCLRAEFFALKLNREFFIDDLNCCGGIIHLMSILGQLTAKRDLVGGTYVIGLPWRAISPCRLCAKKTV